MSTNRLGPSRRRSKPTLAASSHQSEGYTPEDAYEAGQKLFNDFLPPPSTSKPKSKQATKSSQPLRPPTAPVTTWEYSPASQSFESTTIMAPVPPRVRPRITDRPSIYTLGQEVGQGPGGVKIIENDPKMRRALPVDGGGGVSDPMDWSAGDAWSANWQPPQPVEPIPLNVYYPPSAAKDNDIRVQDRISRHARRRLASAHRWNVDIIPQLIRPFMEYSRISQSGGPLSNTHSVTCFCGRVGVYRSITCVYMDRLVMKDLRICSCCPAPVQLVMQGLFPCSPVYPTLAVSLEMLEFVSDLFVHLAPNERAWADALTLYLSRHGYRFSAADSLRRRFANALAQYQALVRITQAEVEKHISIVRDYFSSHVPIPPVSLHHDPPLPSFRNPSSLRHDPSSSRHDPSSSSRHDPSSSSRHDPSSSSRHDPSSLLHHDPSSPSLHGPSLLGKASSQSPVPLLRGCNMSALRAQLPEIDITTSVTGRAYVNSHSSQGHSPQEIQVSLASTHQTGPHLTTEASSSRNIPGPNTDTVPPMLQSEVSKEYIPSSYLQSRCPCCFGISADKNGRSSEIPDVIICLDANFQQKRNRDKDLRKAYKDQDGPRDPELFSPRTVELPHSVAMQWAERVENARLPKSRRHPTKDSKAGQKRKVSQTTELDTANPNIEDTIEAGLHIPNSTYEACGESFIAADGNRVKASTTHFSDTGLVAALCSHDRVIYYLNMWTAGEKQHYALALIDTIMKELPSHWRVGVLYDIGCQLHRSVVKWDLLPDWEARLAFGISVFHAYGHQFICQLWYHPRKASIWGLTDGEGCERLWSDLRHLIPGLRVTGFHRRLFILDMQIEHIDRLKLGDAGDWLRRKFATTQARLETAQAKLAACPHAPDFLDAQFLEQRAYHSRPLDRQSKDKGVRAVERILTVRQQIDAATTLLSGLRTKFTKLYSDKSGATRNQLYDMSSDIEAKASLIKRLEKDEAELSDRLKLGDPLSYTRLEKMKRHAWFEHLLNMRALKSRIIAKICERKFEIANLSGACRSKAVDHNTIAHANKALNKRVRGIKSLVTQYNKRQKAMLDLWQNDDQVPRNAVVPPRIEMKGLFDLDIDKNIWQDVGLDDDDLTGATPPLWLSDDSVRDGIRLAQEATNCRVELERCAKEQLALQEWFVREYRAVVGLYHASSDADIKYFALRRAHELESLAGRWQYAMATILPTVQRHDWPSFSDARLPPQTDNMRYPPTQEPPTTMTIEIDNDDEIDIQSSDDGEDFEIESSVIPDAAILDAADRLTLPTIDQDTDGVDLIDGNDNSDDGGDEIGEIEDFL